MSRDMQRLTTTYHLQRSSYGEPLDRWEVSLYELNEDLEDEDSRTFLGHARVYMMDEHAPQVRGRGLIDVADEISQGLLEVAEFTDDPSSRVEEKFDMWIGNWLYIEEVEIVEQERGNGLGLRLVADLVSVLSNHTCPVVLKAAPLRPTESSEDFELVSKRLANYWSKLRFFELGENYMGLDTACITPEIDDLVVAPLWR